MIQCFDCYNAFRRCPLPVLASVQGKARSFGCAMAALSDVTIAAANAEFQLPEMGYNVFPGMVLSALADRATRKGILYMVHSTTLIGAERALNYGIVSDVVPAGELEQTVEGVAQAILRSPAVASRAVKEYFTHSMDMNAQAAVDFARNLHATINSSSEMRIK